MKKLKYVIMFVFAAAFSGMAVLLGFVIKDTNNLTQILKNGTQVEATITEVMYKTDSDGDRDYYLHYTYTVNGKSYYGKTKASLTYEKAKIIADKGTLQIKYDSNFNSLEIFYDGSSIYFLLIPMFLFVGVSVAFFIAVIKSIVDAIKLKSIMKKGIITTATFSNYQTSFKFNGIPYYKIVYNFRNDNNLITNSSPCDYTFDEANYYSDVKTFEIKAFGNKSVIYEKPYRQVVNKNSGNAEIEEGHADLLEKFEILKEKYETLSKNSEKLSEQKNEFTNNEKAIEYDDFENDTNPKLDRDHIDEKIDTALDYGNIKPDISTDEIICGHCAHINDIKNKRCENCREKLK